MMGDRWRVRKKKRRDGQGKVEVEYEQEIPRTAARSGGIDRTASRAGRLEIVLNAGRRPVSIAAHIVPKNVQYVVIEIRRRPPRFDSAPVTRF